MCLVVVVGEEQLCCYRILNALYTLGTRSSTFVQRSVYTVSFHSVLELSSKVPGLCRRNSRPLRVLEKRWRPWKYSKVLEFQAAVLESSTCKQVIKVVWHKDASPPNTDSSVTFARLRQCAPHLVGLPVRPHPHRADSAPAESLWVYRPPDMRMSGHVLDRPFPPQNCPFTYGNIPPIIYISTARQHGYSVYRVQRTLIILLRFLTRLYKVVVHRWAKTHKVKHTHLLSTLAP